MAVKSTGKVKTDRLQWARWLLTELVPATGIIEPVKTSISINEPVGIEIVEARYFVRAADANALVDGADYIRMGLTQIYKGGSVPSTAYELGLISYQELQLKYDSDVGQQMRVSPIVDTLPEPMLVHPAALYSFCQGVSMAAVVIMSFWMGFRYIQLSDKDYQDILQGVVLQDTI